MKILGLIKDFGMLIIALPGIIFILVIVLILEIIGGKHEY